MWCPGIIMHIFREYGKFNGMYAVGLGRTFASKGTS